MRSFILATALAAGGAVGFVDAAQAQIVVSVGGGGGGFGPVFPGGGLAYTSAYGYGFSPYYGYSSVPYGYSGYTLGRTYGLYTSPGVTYGTTYYPAYPTSGYYPSGYYSRGYRRGWRRW